MDSQGPNKVSILVEWGGVGCHVEKRKVGEGIER